MATALLFFPLPSTPFLHQRNPKPFSSRRSPHLIFPLRAVTSASVVTPVVADELLDISKLGISEHIVSALSRRGITDLFPIQRAVLEPAMEGRDMIGRAVTGSGKTLAFGIPILDKIIRNQNQNRRRRVPSALVLAPTRELARQVQREFKASAPNLSSTCVYGGIPIGSQMQTLGFGMDIVVGTPGRIIDLVERGALDLSEVKFVVLDEADQMLAVGFQEAVECIMSYLPARKQCMLFSATMPSWVKNISRKYMQDPLVVDLISDSNQKLAEGISFYSVVSATPNKQNLLPTLISGYAQGGKSIIFTKTKKDAESLSRSMGRIIGSKALHGNMQQLQRDRTLAAFRDGRFNVLIATDVAARGLHIPNVDLVIHFEMPNSTEFFVHRSGRTGRAGNKGNVILMFTERQRREVRSIEQDLRFKFEELKGITGSVGNGMEMEASSFESDDNLVHQRPSYPDRTFDRQYRSNGRFNALNTSRYSEGSFTRKNFSSGAGAKPRHDHYGSGQTRRTQLPMYDDFKNSQRSSFERYPRQGTNRGTASSDKVYGNRKDGHMRMKQSTLSQSRDYDFDDYKNGQRSSFEMYPRQGAKRGSASSDKVYGNRKDGHMRMKQSIPSQSRDYDFDDLLDLFKDQD